MAEENCRVVIYEATVKPMGKGGIVDEGFEEQGCFNSWQYRNSVFGQDIDVSLGGEALRLAEIQYLKHGHSGEHVVRIMHEVRE